MIIFGESYGFLDLKERKILRLQLFYTNNINDVPFLSEDIRDFELNENYDMNNMRSDFLNGLRVFIDFNEE